MNDRFFLDTNVLVYSFDTKEAAKQKRAQALIDEALSEKQGFISSQVLQEFMNVALRKFQKPFSYDEAREYLREVLEPLCDVYANARLYHRALEVQNKMSVSYYDSLIVAAAAEGGAKILFSEDFQDGQRIEGMTIKNPFRS